jgi:hypothetical protein
VSGGGATVDLRLLYRRDMLELYLDDFLLPVVLQSGPGSGRIGVLPNAASATMAAGLRGFQMSLPGTARWPLHPLPPPPPAPHPVPAGDLCRGAPTSCSGSFTPSPPKCCACAQGADGGEQRNGQRPAERPAAS